MILLYMANIQNWLKTAVQVIDLTSTKSDSNAPWYDDHFLVNLLFYISSKENVWSSTASSKS